MDAVDDSTIGTDPTGAVPTKIEKFQMMHVTESGGDSGGIFQMHNLRQEKEYLLNLVDETGAIDKVDDIVITGRTEVFFSQVVVDAVGAEYLGAMRAQLGLKQFSAAQRTHQFAHFDLLV